MSIFKTQWVVIKSKKISEKNNLYTIFTSDYGKILCNKKFSTREKPLDSGYLINFEIEVKEWINIHKIKNIKILKEFNSFWKDFSLINNFLKLLNIIDKKVPEKLENREIFQTLENIIRYEQPHSLIPKEGRNITSSKIILIQLKIYNILWTLDLEHKNPTIKKILTFINKNKSWEILRLSGINKEIERELEILI